MTNKKYLLEYVDLHQHCLLSANYSDLLDFGVPKAEINSLADLTHYAKKYINPLCNKIENIKLLIKSNLDTCIKKQVKYISTSVDYTVLKYFESIDHFIAFLKEIIDEYNNGKVTISFELGISRNNYKNGDYSTIFALIDTKFFKAIDLYGDEMLGEAKDIFKIYSYARKKQMILKAHIGEFRCAKDVKKLYKHLHLNEIQHGISIVKDEKIMKFFSKQPVVFNVCPTSNKLLNNIYYSPNLVRILLDNNIKFTIGSDDYLFFHSAVSDEYGDLIKCGIISEEEMKKINSFAIFYYKRAYINL